MLQSLAEQFPKDETNQMLLRDTLDKIGVVLGSRSVNIDGLAAILRCRVGDSTTNWTLLGQVHRFFLLDIALELCFIGQNPDLELQ